MHQPQPRSSSLMSSQRLSALRGLRQARQELQKETFFEELIKACDEQLSKPEKQFLIDCILAPKNKDKKHSTQGTHSTQRMSVTLRPHQRFTLLNTTKQNKEEQWQDVFAPIQQGIFQSKRTSKQVPVNIKQRLSSNYRSSSLQKYSSTVSGPLVPETEKDEQGSIGGRVSCQNRYFKTRVSNNSSRLSILKRQQFQRSQGSFVVRKQVQRHYHSGFISDLFSSRPQKVPIQSIDNAFGDEAFRQSAQKSIRQAEETHRKAKAVQQINRGHLKRVSKAFLR